MKPRHYLGIAAAVLIGLSLRTWNLTHHGFVHYDEPHYMLEMKFWKNVFHHRAELLEAMRAGRLSAEFVESRIDGLPPGFTPKPLHGFFIALFSFLAGIDSEWVGSLWAAMVGTLSIGLVGWWVSRHFVPSTAVLAALLFAVCRSHVMYSRSQLAEADAIFFLLVGLFFHVNAALRFRKDSPIDPRVRLSGGRLMLTGLVYGAAIGVNYRVALVLPIVFLWDLWTCRMSFRRLGFLGAGIAAVMALIELPYRIYIWRGGALPNGMSTYLESFLERLVRDAPDQDLPVGEFFSPHWGLFDSFMYLDQGWWILGLALGLWATLQSRCPVRRLVCLLAWLPLIGFSLIARGDSPRAVMTSIPFFVVLAAFGWKEYYDWFERRDLRIGCKLVVGLILCVLIGMGAGSWKETQVSSAWPEVSRWLSQQPRQMIYTTNPLAVRFYMGRDDRIRLIPAEVAAVAEPGIWVLDRYQATYSFPYPIVRKLTATYKPDRTFEGRVYPQTGLFLDWGVFLRSGNWREEIQKENMGAIEVYHIQ